MRIPLDYYRILGLPIQATAEQLSQAYRDRAMQLPRREYSEAAIKSRKELLDEAYAVLSDPEQRSAYDASFLTTTYEQDSDKQLALGSAIKSEATDALDPHTPSIDIKSEQLIGAVLILQELGEYELVLKLSQPFLGVRDSISLDKGRLGDPQLVRPDIVLTLALACLELGREQWQQGQYENAATSLETGQEILLREGLFPSVRGEIQADLYKLRPYRVLELLALPEENLAERRNGIRLLQEMLQERMGIDGTGDDQSGLSIDDFLRFIQQLRGYLTAAEQQTLFETEARRPSAVATYLAVYALLARGFAQRQPALIARAKQMLMRLGRRQDVHLEQAVCALLLGQTEEASRALELSQEYEPLAFIREHSQGAPDLLPGLCLYGERWLQKSVFPHFRDLANQKVSLKEYFADEQVQTYLENLSDSPEEISNEWTAVQSQQDTPYATTVPSRSIREHSVFPRSDSRQVSENTGRPLHDEQQPVGTVLQYSGGEQAVAESQWGVEREPAVVTTSRLAALGDSGDRSPTSGVSTLPSTQPIFQTSSAGDSTVTGLPRESSSKSSRRQRPSKGGSSKADSSANTSSGGRKNVEPLPNSRIQRLPEKSKSSTKGRRLIFLTIAGLIGIVILGWVATKALSWLQNLNAPALEGEQPLVQLAQPPVPIPDPGSQMKAPTGPLTPETAQQVVQAWLASKALAFGPNHQVDQLGQILADPALSRSRQSVDGDKQNSAYWQYKHAVEIISAKTSATNPDRATVDAAVKEDAQYYQGGQLDQTTSYNKTLRVQYELIRKDGRWLIRDMAVQ
ncbi:MAG TPA: IMS domain-containing protein [Coleofasciculaceae cyanobacterium]